jgi:hypothetical protein
LPFLYALQAGVASAKRMRRIYRSEFLHSGDQASALLCHDPAGGKNMSKSVVGKARSIALLFGLMFIAFGTIPAYIAVTSGLHSLKMVRSGVQAGGAIVDYVPVRYGTRERGIEGRTRYQPLVRFQTSAGNKVEFIEFNDDLPKGNYPILYLEDDPETAVVDHFMTLWKWPLVSAVTSLLMFAIGGGVVSRSGRIGD